MLLFYFSSVFTIPPRVYPQLPQNTRGISVIIPSSIYSSSRSSIHSNSKKNGQYKVPAKHGLHAVQSKIKSGLRKMQHSERLALQNFYITIL